MLILGTQCLTKDTGIAKSTSATLSGENSVYRAGNTDIKQQGHASDTVNYTKASSSNGDNIMSEHDSSADRIFNNPIYGSYDEEAENIYADLQSNSQLGTRMESSPKSDYEFDNPIYNWKDDEKAHSIDATPASVVDN